MLKDENTIFCQQVMGDYDRKPKRDVARDIVDELARVLSGNE